MNDMNKKSYPNNPKTLNDTSRTGRYGNYPQKYKSPQAIRGPCKVIEDTYADRVYFDEKELKRLRKKFSVVDIDRTGEITPEQLGNLVELLSHSFRERIIQLTEDKLRAERKDRLNFDDFTRVLSIFSHKCPVELKIRCKYL